MERVTKLLLLLAMPTLGACTGLGREINQAMPEFLRSDPGAEEMAVFRRVRESRTWTEEDLAEQDRRVAEIAAAQGEEEWGDAVSKIENYLDDYPVSRHDEEMRFQLGRSHYGDEEWERAFNAWREFSILHPVSSRNGELTDTLYAMGQDFIAGNHASFFGIFTQRSVGVKILEHLTESFPSSVRAADAQWTLAEYYREEEQWPDAQAAYEFLIERYRTSEWYQPSLYYAAYCQYRRVKGEVYDPAIMQKAQEGFDLYLASAPDGAWRGDATELSKSLEEMRARHVLRTAEWYIGQDKPYSARFYLKDVVTRFPSSTAATRAAELLAREDVRDEETGGPPPRPAGSGEGS